MSYDEVISYFYNSIPNFHKYGNKDFKPGLEKINDLLNAIGNPEKDLDFIHLAGTNGKGSTSNFLAHYFIESGYKTALFTSPHLFDFRERIQINRSYIPKEYIINFYNTHFDLFEELKPSFFELTFALSLDYFKSEKVEICIIETGLGGRLDATNIIKPILAIITNIGLDHTEFLGETIEKISFEKGGIIKNNTPVVLGNMLPEAEMVLSQIAKDKNATLLKYESHQIAFFNYQQDNYNLALTSLEYLKKIGWEALNLNLDPKNVQILGRFQTLQEKPKIILDVAHNEAGFQSLFNQAEILKQKSLYILFGGTKEKDLNKILKTFPKNAKVNFSSFSNPRSLTQEDFKNQNEIQNYRYFSSPVAALKSIQSELKSDETLLICGSFYLIADLKPLLDSLS